MISMIPNCITSLRIVGTIGMLFMKPYSAAFYITYILCGFTDILDGFIARLTKTTSELGAKLDSIADLLYYIVMAVKIFPELLARLPDGVWYIVWTTVAVRAANYIYVAVRFHKFASTHTILNKLTGLVVFLLPFSLLLPAATVPYGYVGAVIAAVATIYEVLLHFRRGTNNTTQPA